MEWCGWNLVLIEEKGVLVPITPGSSRWVAVGPVLALGWRELSGAIGSGLGTTVSYRELLKVKRSNGRGQGVEGGESFLPPVGGILSVQVLTRPYLPR